MNHNEMLSIVEQFENIGLLCDTGKRRDGKVLFRFGMPSPEKMDERTSICNPSRPHMSVSPRCEWLVA